MVATFALRTALRHASSIRSISWRFSCFCSRGGPASKVGAHADKTNAKTRAMLRPVSFQGLINVQGINVTDSSLEKMRRSMHNCAGQDGHRLIHVEMMDMPLPEWRRFDAGGVQTRATRFSTLRSRIFWNR